jgi:hypothetical protein
LTVSLIGTGVDKVIAGFAAVADGDLSICETRGIAYQRDMRAGRVQYDAPYMAKVDAYEDSPVAVAVNAGRCALIARHLKRGAWVLDYGAGSGAFVRDAAKAGFYANGFDVMRQAKKRLFEAGVYADDPSGFDAVTLWDTLEHLEDPGHVLRQVRLGGRLFVSIPVFGDLRRIRDSRHYRPGEHLYYFTVDGFTEWIANYGFRLLEYSLHEIQAGRENIGAFAFVRDLECNARQAA